MKHFFTVILLSFSVLMLSCNDDGTDKPNNPDIKQTFTTAAGEYFGDKNDNGTGLFAVVLENSTYSMRLEFNSSVVEDPEQTIYFDEGTYSRSSATVQKLTYNAGTSASAGTSITEKSSSSSTKLINDGTFKVTRTEDSYTVTTEFTATDGTKVECSFNGVIAITDRSGITRPPGETIEMNLGTFAGEYYGDLFGTNSTYLWLYLYNGDIDPHMNDYFNDHELIKIDCFNTFYDSENLKLEDGIYELSTGAYTALTYLPGNLNLEDEIYEGTCFQRVKLVGEDLIGEMILIEGGTFTVSSNGDNYTITTDFFGTGDHDDGTITFYNHIKLTYTGTITRDDFYISNEIPENVMTAATVTYYEHIHSEEFGSYQLMIGKNISSDQSLQLAMWLYGDILENPSHDNISLREGTYYIKDQIEAFAAKPGEFHTTSISGTHLSLYTTLGGRPDMWTVIDGYVTVTKIDEGYDIRTFFVYEDVDTKQTVELPAYYYRGSINLYTHTPLIPKQYTDTFENTANIRFSQGVNVYTGQLKVNSADGLHKFALLFHTEKYDLEDGLHLPEGTYTVQEDYYDTPAPFTIHRGGYSYGYGLEYSYYCDTEEWDPRLEFRSGTCEVTHLGGNNYKLEFDLLGMEWRANKSGTGFSGVFEGEIIFE